MEIYIVLGFCPSINKSQISSIKVANKKTFRMSMYIKRGQTTNVMVKNPNVTALIVMLYYENLSRLINYFNVITKTVISSIYFIFV